MRFRVQNTGYEDSQLIGYFNGIKKTEAEMKFTLSEIKKNLQGRILCIPAKVEAYVDILSCFIKPKEG